MNRVLRIIKRAASASPHEWWTRGSQVAFAARNWMAVKSGGSSAFSSRGHLRALGVSQTEICDWWSSRRTQWFIDDDRKQTLSGLADCEESYVPWILEKADDVLVDRLPMFSHDIVEYSGKDRWHRDFITGKQAPKEFYGRVPYLDSSIVGDHKYTWEPNRFAWAMWLGIAYLIRGEEKYAQKFSELSLDWFESNPYPIGINYCSALELAYRNYAWLWSLSLFDSYLRTQPKLLERFLRGIWVGTRHVEENLSTYFSPNTHITGEAFGIFAVGAAIPEYRDSARWRKLGLSILETEAERQFYQDGMHRELSSGYHIYSTDLLLHTMLIGQESGFRVPNPISDTAKRAARRLSEIVPNSMNMPQFNDCDGGRLLSLVPSPVDAAPTLTAAESVFPNQSFLPNADMQPAGYPLLMTPLARGQSKTRRKPTAMTVDRDLRKLYDSGIASYRNDKNDYGILRATDFGYQDCPHSHDAGLGIILHLGGTPIFLDNGVGSYIQTVEMRNEFRMAMGKNTMLLDGVGPSLPADDSFAWETTTDSELVSLRYFPDGFTARGKHNGFTDSSRRNAFVQRELIMLEFGIVAVVDRWDSDDEISPESRFTLNPQLRFDPARLVLNTCDGEAFHLLFASLNAGEEIEIHHNTVKFSPNYGLVTDTTAISACTGKSTRGGLVTFVSRCGPLARLSETLVGLEDGSAGIQFELSRSGVRVSNQQLTSA